MKHLLRHPLLVLIVWLAQLLTSKGVTVPVEFAWDDIPVPFTRLQTHLLIVGPNGPLFLAAAPGMATTLTVDMEPGVYQVAAASEWVPGDWGQLSEVITVVVTEEVRLTLRESDNPYSGPWTDIEVIVRPVTGQRKKFYQLKIETP